MPSRRTRTKPKTPKRTALLTRRKLQVVVTAAVGLSLIAGWTMLAHSGALDPVFRQQMRKSQRYRPLA